MGQSANSQHTHNNSRIGASPARAVAPEAQGLYDPFHEHDSCGVGFIVQLKGQKSHKIVAGRDHRARAPEPPRRVWLRG